MKITFLGIAFKNMKKFDKSKYFKKANGKSRNSTFPTYQILLINQSEYGNIATHLSKKRKQQIISQPI